MDMVAYLLAACAGWGRGRRQWQRQLAPQSLAVVLAAPEAGMETIPAISAAPPLVTRMARHCPRLARIVRKRPAPPARTRAKVAAQPFANFAPRATTVLVSNDGSASIVLRITDPGSN